MESCTSLERAIQGKGQAKQNQVGKTVKHNPKPRKERALPPGSPSRAGFYVHARSDCNGSSWSEKCARFVRLGPAPLECFGAPQAYTVELGHDSPCARICLELNRHTASSPASRDEHANVAAVIRMSMVVTGQGRRGLARNTSVHELHMFRHCFFLFVILASQIRQFHSLFCRLILDSEMFLHSLLTLCRRVLHFSGPPPSFLSYPSAPRRSPPTARRSPSLSRAASTLLFLGANVLKS